MHKTFILFALLAGALAGAAAFVGCGGEGCQLQGACPNLGDVTYDNCCVVGGNCTFRFTDGHTVGPYNPNDFQASQAALNEASEYCLGNAGEGEGEGE